MLELILTIIYAVCVFFLDEVWIIVFISVIYAFLVGPGLYAMFFGAPYIPTDKKRLEAMIRLGDFRASDTVYDLGCGDGRVISKVAKIGVKKAVGFEMSILVYIYAKSRSLFSGNGEVVKYGNFWKSDLKEANKVIVFLLEKSMKEFEKKIWPKLTKGTQVISNEFLMESVEPLKKEGRVYLYQK